MLIDHLLHIHKTPPFGVSEKTLVGADILCTVCCLSPSAGRVAKAAGERSFGDMLRNKKGSAFHDWLGL